VVISEKENMDNINNADFPFLCLVILIICTLTMKQWILHNWKDEECVKILKNCKEAIASEGRVIIIDMVMENKKEEREFTETQFFFDMQMMMLFAAKERNEKEWANLIFSAGFTNYKITPILGLSSIIEVYP